MKGNGKWALPVNMGKRINTRLDEQSPFIHPDNQTLYFSSDGHIGMGEDDLYLVRKDTAGEWGPPMNLGFPINTHKTETSLVVGSDGKTAYFSSDRFEDGYGQLDLYSFPLYEAARPQPVTYISGVTFDVMSNAMLGASLELVDLETGVVVARSKSDPNRGDFLICLPAGKEYAFNAASDGYLFYSEHFKLKAGRDNKPVAMDIPMQPIIVGQSMVLKNIFFETDSYQLKQSSKIELQRLAQLLKGNQGMRIEIGGHTDNQGSKSLNLTLSRNRAKAVLDFLVKQGIDASRLTHKGFGDSKPIADNGTEAGRAKNRRTAFTVLSR
jgi:outer membrane protein OmpA-like peptidoglycan-associated protein